VFTRVFDALLAPSRRMGAARHHCLLPRAAVTKAAPLRVRFGAAPITAAICGAVARACHRLTRLGSFLMSGRGTPLPTEGRLSGRVDS
jgi:hypothetical protein